MPANSVGCALKLANIVRCTELSIKVENDKGRPSLQMLHKIVAALNTSIGALFSDTYGRDHVVLRALERPVLQIGSRRKVGGVTFECLIPYQDKQAALRLNPCHRAWWRQRGAILSIRGEEVGYVLEGEFEITVDEDLSPLGRRFSFF